MPPNYTKRQVFQCKLRQKLGEWLLLTVKSLDRPSEKHLFPTLLDMPTYKYKITHDMDLSKIESRCKNHYLCVEELELDVLLMLDNALAVFGEGSSYSTLANNLRDYAVPLLAKLKEKFEVESAKPEYQEYAESMRQFAAKHLSEHPSNLPKEGLARDLSGTSTLSEAEQELKLARLRALTPNAADPEAVESTETATVDEPPKKRRKLAPTVLTGFPMDVPPQGFGNGVLTSNLVQILRRDETEMVSLAESPPDTSVALSMGLGTHMWTTATVCERYLLLLRKRKHLRAEEVRMHERVVKNLRTLFEEALCASLLYRVEHRVHEHFVASQHIDAEQQSWAELYPIKYFLRLLAHLPTLLGQQADIVTSRAMLRIVQDIIFFIDKNYEIFKTDE